MKQQITAKNYLICEPKKLINWDFLEPMFKIAIVVIGILITVFAIQNNLIFQSTISQKSGFERIFLKGMFITSMFIFLSSLIFRTILWFRYRAFQSKQIKHWPKVTIAVPVFNEGAAVYNTIQSIVSCDYPHNKMEILAINDGSTDDSLKYLKMAAEEYPQLVKIINFKKNRGKRDGIYEAYKKSTSPYLMTIDSDTVLNKDAIKEILAPMILDKKIAAVTGRIKVLNKEKNVLTRMLSAHFAMAFDFTRAIQSTFSTVFCLAGAFSAYRKSVLDKVIDPWLGQKFLNIKCTYGEDRSLTNHILREGYGSFFQRSAICQTIVPEGLFKTLKMFTRWARSNIRESIIFSKIVLSPKRKGNHLLPFFEFYSTVSLVLIHFIWFYYFIFSGVMTTNFIARALSYSIIFGFFYALYYIRIEGTKDSPYIILFSLFSSVFMIWVFTIAGFTLTKSSWSTR
jgi:hyaluronan synthase